MSVIGFQTGCDPSRYDRADGLLRGPKQPKLDTPGNELLYLLGARLARICENQAVSTAEEVVELADLLVLLLRLLFAQLIQLLRQAS